MMKKLLIAAAALFLFGLVLAEDASARGRYGPGRGWYGHGWHGHGWNRQGWRGHGWRHHYGRGRIGLGVIVGAPLWYSWHHSPYYHPPVVIEREEPLAYIERPVPVESRPPAQTVYSGYWYYCQSPGGYYPEVQACPTGWVKIPPRP